METPSRDVKKNARRRFTSEEKKQILANLDLEGTLVIAASCFSLNEVLVYFSSVVHRTRQYEESLAQILENFRNHHEGQVLRVPKLVRSITMAEFADKYNGDINECLRGLQKDRQGGEPTLDPALKKRKWKDTEDAPGPEDAESSLRAQKAGPLFPVTLPFHQSHRTTQRVSRLL